MGEPVSAPVAVLYARRDSVYKSISGCDVYDIDRDARTFSGGLPVIAHPPCRAWGTLSHMAKPMPHEKDLARHAVSLVQSNGGVLEHPYRSKLWQDQNLPPSGQVDRFGGFTLAVPQFWFGHPAMKNTLLYIVGIDPTQVPDIPFTLEYPRHCIGQNSKTRKKAHKHLLPVSDAKREHTPAAFAHFLVDIARQVGAK